MRTKVFVQLTEDERTKFKSGYDRAVYAVEQMFGSGHSVVYLERRYFLQVNDPDDVPAKFIFLVWSANRAGVDEGRLEIAGYLTRDEFFNLAKSYQKQKLYIEMDDLTPVYAGFPPNV